MGDKYEARLPTGFCQHEARGPLSETMWPYLCTRVHDRGVLDGREERSCKIVDI